MLQLLIHNIYLEYCIIPCGLPSNVLTDNDSQFSEKFHPSVRPYMGVKQLTNMAYNPHTNCQTERYNKNIVGRIQNYVTEHQEEREEFLQTFTYAESTRVYRSTTCTSF